MRHSPVVALLALAACAGIGHPSSPVTVTSTGQELSLSPRVATCRIEFHSTKRPDRSYDEVAILHVAGSAEAAQEMMRRKACELGADAVIVTADFVGVMNERRITATAVSYPELRERHRTEHRRALEAWRKTIEGMRRPDALPLAYVPARALREVVLSGHFTNVASDQLIWASREPSLGYHQILTQDGGEGVAPVDALELAPVEALGPAADERAPDASRPAAPPRTEI